mgnify:CR=1 FL=1
MRIGGSLTIVCGHHMEDSSWILDVADIPHVFEIVVYDTKQLTLPTHPKISVIDKSKFIKKGFPSIAYHYCANYTPRTTHVIFLHGHNKSWHQKMSIAQIVHGCVQILCRNPFIPFVKLSDAVYKDWLDFDNGYGMLDFVHRYWNTLSPAFPDDIMPPAMLVDINTEQCLVHRDRLRDRSHADWQLLFELACNVKFHSWEEYALEGVFHRVMGEPWVRDYIHENLNAIADGKNELELRLDEIGKHKLKST